MLTLNDVDALGGHRVFTFDCFCDMSDRFSAPIRSMGASLSDASIEDAAPGMP